MVEFAFVSVFRVACVKRVGLIAFVSCLCLLAFVSSLGLFAFVSRILRLSFFIMPIMYHACRDLCPCSPELDSRDSEGLSLGASRVMPAHVSSKRKETLKP